MFLMQLGTVLERYADDIVERITHPLTGIQSKCKFPPSMAEVAELCESIRRQSTYATNWDRRAAEQLAERKAYEQQRRIATPEDRARALEIAKQMRERVNQQEADRRKKIPWSQQVPDWNALMHHHPSAPLFDAA